jgi:uncharacterized protein (TIGR03503 family)
MKKLFLAGLLCTLPLMGICAEQDKITPLERDGIQNEIPLLENRFRIDHKVEKITLLFFRERGTPAVVLVRPDGSKYHVTESLNNDDLDWHDEMTYDLITIANPMPGPWQVVGSILPDSRIIVMGEIELSVDPLPPVLFRGETIKLTGRVLNDGEPIEVGQFRDVISLHVDFVSTNNSDYANFGAGTQSITDFKDDGRGFDERPLDGVFTGEFQLSFPAGEWQPELYIETPILKRTVVQKPIVIHEPPFSYEMTLAEHEADDHLLTITLNPEVIKPETVLVQGKIYYPNNEEQMFSMDAKASQTRQLAIKNYDWGRYSVELLVFGSNINDREFMATLPTYKFEIDRPIEVVPEIVRPEIDLEAQSEQQRILEEEQRASTMLMITLIVVGNLTVLLLGWLAIRVFVQKKPLKFKFSLPFLKKKNQTSNDEQTAGEKEVGKNGSKNDKSGEILNLSMSDD